MGERWKEKENNHIHFLQFQLASSQLFPTITEQAKNTHGNVERGIQLFTKTTTTGLGLWVSWQCREYIYIFFFFSVFPLPSLQCCMTETSCSRQQQKQFPKELQGTHISSATIPRHWGITTTVSQTTELLLSPLLNYKELKARLLSKTLSSEME